MPVPRNYVADSTKGETILFGNELENGMRVLIEDKIFRGWESVPGESARIAECNEWCEVTRLSRKNDIVRFVGIYDDGTMRVRTYANELGWIVKLDSMMSEHE